MENKFTGYQDCFQFTGYQSPVELYTQAMQSTLEDGILEAIQSYAINVDKEELIKALRYDRKQYEKGYRDAKSESPWISIEDRLPEVGQNVLVVFHKNQWEVGWMCSNYDFQLRNELIPFSAVTYWAPLYDLPQS